MKLGVLFFATIALLAGIWFVMLSADQSTSKIGKKKSVLPDGSMVSVVLPTTLTGQEQIGKRAFDAVCATCHGANAQGRDGEGPPLVHKIYERGHHGDMAFVNAAQNGVRAHHWKFGSMPPVEGVTRGDILNIVSYVRALQTENGIR